MNLFVTSYRTLMLSKGSAIRNFLEWVSSNDFLGMPLDILFHFFGGMLFTLICLKIHIRFIWIFSAVVILSLLKEVFDSSTMTWTWIEATKDVLVTILFPAIYWSVKKMRKK